MESSTGHPVWHWAQRGAVAFLFTFALLQGPVSLWAQSPEEAVALQQQGDWPGAERVWRQLTHSAPTDFRYWTSLGACLAHQNRYDEAIENYRKSLRLSPQDPQTNHNLGLAYFKSGKLDLAIPSLIKAERLLPQAAAQVKLLLGMSFYGTGQAARAVPYLETAASREPENGELQLVLARAYLEAGAFEKAQQQFVRMLTADPDSAQVHLLLGQAYDGLGKSTEALAEFRLAAKEGAVRGAHFGVGYLLLRDKNFAEAVSEFRTELAANPTDYAALGYLGDALLKSGNPADARSYLERSIAVEDKLWITHFDLGTMAEEARSYQVAIQEFRRAMALNAKRPEIHYRLAQAFKAVGRNSDAQSELRKVQELHSERNDDLIIKVSGPGK